MRVISFQKPVSGKISVLANGGIWQRLDLPMERVVTLQGLVHTIVLMYIPPPLSTTELL